MNNKGRGGFWRTVKGGVVFRDRFMYSEQQREGWSSETGSCTVNNEGRGGLQRQVHVH